MGLIRYVLSLLATLFLVIVEINLAPLLIPYFLLLIKRGSSRDEQNNFSRQFESPPCLLPRGLFYAPMRPQPATLQRPQAEIGPQAAAPQGGLGISL